MGRIIIQCSKAQYNKILKQLSGEWDISKEKCCVLGKTCYTCPAIKNGNDLSCRECISSAITFKAIGD